MGFKTQQLPRTQSQVRLRLAISSASVTEQPLVRRIQLEARTFANAKGSSREPMALGRVYGLLEAGVVLGYWTRKRADAAGELVRHRYRIDRLPDVLLRDRDVAPMTTRDVATRLGVSRQRVEQLLSEGKLPQPTTRSGRVRLWDRAELDAWAKREWWAGDGRRRRQSSRSNPPAR